MFRKKLNFGNSTNVKMEKDDNGDYSENCQKPDLRTEIYQLNEEKDKLEQESRCQSTNGKWMEERRKLLKVA